MSNYVRHHLKGVTGGRRRREMAAATVPFPDDIHTFIDEYMNNKYGYPGIRSFPRERHLAYLTTDPYHIRRIPHSVHNKLILLLVLLVGQWQRMHCHLLLLRLRVVR